MCQSVTRRLSWCWRFQDGLTDMSGSLCQLLVRTLWFSFDLSISRKPDWASSQNGGLRGQEGKNGHFKYSPLKTELSDLLLITSIIFYGSSQFTRSAQISGSGETRFCFFLFPVWQCHITKGSGHWEV